MTGGVPVVWLTRQQSNLLTAADVAHLQKHGCLDRKEGDPMFGGKARLTVHLNSRKRLMRYGDFLRQEGRALNVDPAGLPPTAPTQWYIYFGGIPPRRIDTGLPAAVALECLDHHIATHPDPDARERYKAQPAQIAQLPDNARIDFDIT